MCGYFGGGVRVGFEIIRKGDVIRVAGASNIDLLSSLYAFL